MYSGTPHPEAHRLRARRPPPPGGGPLNPSSGPHGGCGRVFRGGSGRSGALAGRQRAARGLAGWSWGFQLFCCLLVVLNVCFDVMCAP